MQPDSGRLRSIKKVPGYRLPNIVAQIVPSISLSENVMRKTFRDITSVTLLRHVEDNSHE